MKKFFNVISAIFLILSLGGCLASTTSPIGVNCDFSKGKPLWEMNQDCYGGV